MTVSKFCPELQSKAVLLKYTVVKIATSAFCRMLSYEKYWNSIYLQLELKQTNNQTTHQDQTNKIKSKNPTKTKPPSLKYSSFSLMPKLPCEIQVICSTLYLDSVRMGVEAQPGFWMMIEPTDKIICSHFITSTYPVLPVTSYSGVQVLRQLFIRLP